MDNGDDDDPEEVVELTAEQKIELEHDEQNIHVEVLARGDGENFAMVGDIVRLRYSCFLEGDPAIAAKMKKNWKTKDERPPDGKLVASTKSSMGR